MAVQCEHVSSIRDPFEPTQRENFNRLLVLQRDFGVFVAEFRKHSRSTEKLIGDLTAEVNRLTQEVVRVSKLFQPSKLKKRK